MCIRDRFDHNKYLDALEKIVNLCDVYSVPCGEHIVNPDPKLLHSRIKQGFRLLAYGTDGVFLNSACKNPEK